MEIGGIVLLLVVAGIVGYYFFGKKDGSRKKGQERMLCPRHSMRLEFDEVRFEDEAGFRVYHCQKCRFEATRPDPELRMANFVDRTPICPKCQQVMEKAQGTPQDGSGQKLSFTCLPCNFSLDVIFRSANAMREVSSAAEHLKD